MRIILTRDIIAHCGNLVDQSKKEGLLFSGNLLYFVIYDVFSPYAFFGLKINKTSAIMKCDYVSKDYRGQGTLLKMINARLNWIKDNKPNIKTVYANCTNMALNSHLKSGAKIVTKYKNEITKIKYEIL